MTADALKSNEVAEPADAASPEVAAPVAKPSTKRKRPAKKARKADHSKAETSKKAGPKRPYPRATLEEALRIPFALKDKNGGNAWPPSDLARAVGLSHKNPDFFYLAAASRDFGLTEGSRDSEQISLTEFGRDVVYAPGNKKKRLN